ncbi:MAG: SDR family oxidoreductase [Actinomycetota bacterium]|nr:SDR family oxidoreductase [Actinomycetota bacterium]
MAAEGATVAVTYKDDRAGGESLAADIRASGGSAAVSQYNLADPGSPERLIRHVVDTHGGLDLLVANAVVWPRGDLSGTAPWRDALRANLEGTLATVQAALPHLLTRRGRLVLISSTVAVDGMPGATTYAATKAVLHGIVAALSAEHAPAGVLANAVLPGLTLTDRAQRLIPKAVRDDVASRTPTRRLADPHDIAQAVAFLGSHANRTSPAS